MGRYQLVRGRATLRAMSELAVTSLLATSSVELADVCCAHSLRGRSTEEYATRTHLVFPYRGIFVRHLGQEDAVAEPGRLLLFNPAEIYRVSHPLPGGDDCLDLLVDEALLRELTPPALLRDGAALLYRIQSVRIDPRAQALVALLRHSLARGMAEPLEAESLALTLVRRALGPRAARQSTASTGRRRLVDRIKLVLASDLSRRWTLGAIAAEVGGSPVYLTQVFQQVEGLPLYRYQLQLRLARALELLAKYEDLAALGLETGFSSHSHFTTSFRRAYGRSPSEFRQLALRA
jgi:AraC family transcriptional regulator